MTVPSRFGLSVRPQLSIRHCALMILSLLTRAIYRSPFLNSRVFRSPAIRPSTRANGVSKLGLIGVDGITSGPPGGTLTFTGLDLLLLATVNGSINLTSDVSFQDLHELVMYARGAGSDLTINSPISNIGILGLVAEDSIHLTNPGTMSVGKLQMATGSDLMLQIGGSLLLNGSVRLDAIVLPGASVASGVNLTLNVTGDYTNNSATASSHLTITNRDHIGGDASIAVGATNIFIANNLDVQIDNRVGGHIGENALVNVGVSGGDINIVGDATFQILNNDPRPYRPGRKYFCHDRCRWRFHGKFHSCPREQSQRRRHRFGR